MFKFKIFDSKICRNAVSPRQTSFPNSPFLLLCSAPEIKPLLVMPQRALMPLAGQVKTPAIATGGKPIKASRQEAKIQHFLQEGANTGLNTLLSGDHVEFISALPGMMTSEKPSFLVMETPLVNRTMYSLLSCSMSPWRSCSATARPGSKWQCNVRKRKAGLLYYSHDK